MRWLRLLSGIVLWTVATACLTATVLPYFLDRIYYRGPASAHFDGQRFFDPDGEDTLAPSRGTSRTRLIWHQLFGDPDRPAWPDRVAVGDARPPARVNGAAMLATWVGHATLLVQADGVNILTDPVWSETVGPFGIGPRRVAEPGIAFDRLPRIDIVLISHNHYDHMDLATLARLWRRDHPLIVTGLGNDAILRAHGIAAQAFDWGKGTGIGAPDSGPQFTGDCAEPALWCTTRAVVTVTRSHHWGSRWLADRNRALWSSFVVALPHGNFFFAGDTGAGDMRWPAEAAALGPIRLAAVPIGAFRFEPGQMASGSHIGPRDAIRVWNGLGRPRTIPIHWGTFRLSWEGYWTPPLLLRAMLDCAGGDARRFAAVPIGVPLAVPPLDAQPRAPAPDIAAIDRCTRRGAFDALR